MKKILFLPVLILALLFSFLSYGIADECETHTWYENSNNTYQYEDSGSYNSQGHIYYVYRYETCSVCGEERKTIRSNISSQIQPHDYSIYIGDAGHVRIGVHAYWYQCSKCPTQKAIQKPCDGPPCNNAMTKHNHSEDE